MSDEPPGPLPLPQGAGPLGTEAELAELVEAVEGGRPEHKERVLLALLVAFGADGQGERLCVFFLERALRQCDGDGDRLFAQDTLYKRGALLFLRALLGLRFWRETCGPVLDELRTFDVSLDFQRADDPAAVAGRLLDYASRLLGAGANASGGRGAAAVAGKAARGAGPGFGEKLLLAVLSGFLLQSPARLLGAPLSLTAQRSCVALAKAVQSLSNALTPQLRPAAAAFGARHFDLLLALCYAGLRALPPAPATLPRPPPPGPELKPEEWAVLGVARLPPFAGGAAAAEAALRALSLTKSGNDAVAAAVLVARAYQSEGSALLGWCLDECLPLEREGLRPRRGPGAELPWAVLESFVQYHVAAFMRLQLRDELRRAQDAEALCAAALDKLASSFDLLQPPVLALLGVARDRCGRRAHWALLCCVVELLLVPALRALSPEKKCDEMFAGLLPLFNVDFGDEARLPFVRFCLSQQPAAVALLKRVEGCAAASVEPLFYPAPMEAEEARRVLEEAARPAARVVEAAPVRGSRVEMHPELAAVRAQQARPKTVSLAELHAEPLHIEDLEELVPQVSPRALLQASGSPSGFRRSAASPIPTPARGSAIAMGGNKSGGSSPRNEGEDSAFVLCSYCLCANPRGFGSCRSCKKKNSRSSLAASPVASPPAAAAPVATQAAPVVTPRRSGLRVSAVVERRKSVSEVDLDDDDDSQ